MKYKVETTYKDGTVDEFNRETDIELPTGKVEMTKENVDKLAAANLLSENIESIKIEKVEE